MGTSDWIALIALAVSMASAGWTIYHHFRWARPVIRVSGTQWTHSPTTWRRDPHAGFSIDVTNIGDQATEIMDAYWQIDRGNGVDFRVSSKGDGGIDSLFQPPADPSLRPAPEFPFTLDRYQSRGWDFSVPTEGWRDRHDMKRARTVVEYTSRKSREVVRGDWQPSQIGMEATQKREEGQPDSQ